MPCYAIDFGTSNSLLSFVADDGKITAVPLDPQGSKVLRSLLYTPRQHSWFFGNEAIQEYITNDGEGRFLRSIKKFLPEPSYTGTTVHNQNLNISDLISVFLGEMRKRANQFIGLKVESVVLGRPALYALEKEHDQLAENRMRKAAEMAGFKDIRFCPEPVAAGLDFRQSSQDERVVLIADFGGGTSDFTLMKAHGGTYSQSDILGLSGVFLAGDALDGVMMKDFIAPHFGSNFQYKLPGSGNVLTFPRGLLKKMCSPAHITHLREKDTWEFLQHIGKFALSSDDERHIAHLYALVENQLGFPLFNEIEKTKVQLGKVSESQFSYEALGVSIQQTVSNHDYRSSVTPTVDEIMEIMNGVFTQSGLAPGRVDQVVLTGGTSQFPMLREKLATVFGREKLLEHNIYESVVNGLAQFALRTASY
jgi:hypothetical chaperone protein